MADAGAAPLRIRQGVRALMITPDEHVLLCRFEFRERTVWALPGGGLEPDEDDLTALRRELAEEIGLVEPVIGPHVWEREHIIPFPSGLWDGQRERIYLVEALDRFEPTPTMTWKQLHDEHLHELRWWNLDEIDARAIDAPAGHALVEFAPRRLGPLLRSLLADGPPTTPIDTGI